MLFKTVRFITLSPFTRLWRKVSLPINFNTKLIPFQSNLQNRFISETSLLRSKERFISRNIYSFQYRLYSIDSEHSIMGSDKKNKGKKDKKSSKDTKSEDEPKEPTTVNKSSLETDSSKKSPEAVSSSKKRKIEEESTADKTSETSPSKKLKVEGDFVSCIAAKRTNVCQSVTEFKFNKKRVRVLSKASDAPDDNDGVVYWMSRDQRVQDNWAFLYAQRLALKMEVPLHVCFCLVPKFLEATIRHFEFMLKGLEEVEQECRDMDISFHLLIGYAKDVLPEFVCKNKIGSVIADFAPLRTPMTWVEDVKNNLSKDVPFCQVDAHNIVPCWEASPKCEYGARTIRNKINNQLSTYLTEFPPLVQHKYKAKHIAQKVDWKAAIDSLEVDRTVTLPDWCKPGTKGGLETLESFMKDRIKYFNSERNKPDKNALSNLSPWFHFGQVSVQRSIIMVKELKGKYKESVEGFLEEAIIRRELADNFCFYNKNYDNIEGAYEWARNSLKEHWNDKREYLYTRQQLAESSTHDDLWNAAQYQLVTEGKMHGFLRMYWAKKILEWTENPEVALKDSIYLNDKYSMDGRDPNGYVGCMWSICGIHDQGWKERPIFGKIRYMNYAGCKRKFDVAGFVRKYKVKKPLPNIFNKK